MIPKEELAERKILEEKWNKLEQKHAKLHNAHKKIPESLCKEINDAFNTLVEYDKIITKKYNLTEVQWFYEVMRKI